MFVIQDSEGSYFYGYGKWGSDVTLAKVYRSMPRARAAVGRLQWDDLEINPAPMMADNETIDDLEKRIAVLHADLEATRNKLARMYGVRR